MSECNMCGYREAERGEEYCSFCAMCNRGQPMTFNDYMDLQREKEEQSRKENEEEPKLKKSKNRRTKK